MYKKILKMAQSQLYTNNDLKDKTNLTLMKYVGF